MCWKTPPYTREQMEKDFGKEVLSLVEGVTKLGQFDNLDSQVARSYDERELESLRKMFLAMVDDPRVILIKLADRLHNMRTLGVLPEDRRQRIARETLEIFAPLANRLGIWQMKWELEDLGFRYLYPEKYKEIAQLIDERRPDREEYINRDHPQVAGTPEGRRHQRRDHRPAQAHLQHLEEDGTQRLVRSNL